MQTESNEATDNGHNMAGETYVVASKVKAAMKAAGYNSSADAVTALNKLVQNLISEACARAGANGRKTVRPYDFLATE